MHLRSTKETTLPYVQVRLGTILFLSQDHHMSSCYWLEPREDDMEIEFSQRLAQSDLNVQYFIHKEIGKAQR